MNTGTADDNNLSEHIEAMGDVLLSLPRTPANVFLLERIITKNPKDRISFEQAMIELVESDVPIDPMWRKMIARDLRDLYYPPSKHQRKNKEKSDRVFFYQFSKQLFRRKGRSAPRAEEIAAWEVGKSVEAMRKEVQRTRKKPAK
jgi:hypothetical protein